MQLAADITPDDLKVFLQEADEQLQLLDAEVLHLERNASPDILAAIFRAAHTMKGSSAMIGYREMAEVAHAMESLLDKLRKGELKANTAVVDALLHGVDALRVLKEEMVEPKGLTLDFGALVREIEAASVTTAPVQGKSGETAPGRAPAAPADVDTAITQAHARGLSAYVVKVGLQPESPFRAVRAFQALTELRERGEILRSTPTAAEVEAEQVGNELQVLMVSAEAPEVLRAAVAAVQDVVLADVSAYAPGAPTAGAPTAATAIEADGKLLQSQGADAARPAQEVDASDRRNSQTVQTVRIDVERLDSLMNLIGELVIDRTRIEQIGRSLAARYQGDDLVDSLGRTSAHVVKVVNDLQEDFMKVRMLPIGTVFNSFPRMMRDLARTLGKELDFRVNGGDTEIDKTVIERIRDPLVHLLRNALDHGLEQPADRVSAGKAAAGVIELNAYHEQGHIFIVVKDDGRGIQAEKVKASAVAKGLISAEVAARMSAEEAADLIFLAGTSTKDQATEVSGRGVGMDIVRSNIEAINGYIEIDTVPGQGSTFTMRLPLTLATVKSILVRSGDTLCAVPLSYVLEVVRLSPEAVSTVRGREVFRLREKVLPLVDMAEATGMTGESRAVAGARRHVVVVKMGERLAGIGVDELLEPLDIVVKSLGKLVGDTRNISGASILGDGRVVLILDAASLITAAMGRASATSMTEAAAPAQRTAHAPLVAVGTRAGTPSGERDMALPKAA